MRGGTDPGSSGAGRVAVVTGATSGIGKEVARGLAAWGARTVVVGRGEERSARIAHEIAVETKNASVESVGVEDLARTSEVRRLAATLLERYPRLDVLVNNAGAVYVRRDVSAEGIERTFALNVLAPFLLTSLLVPSLVAAAPSRVVNVSSAAHRGATVDFADLEMARHYHGFRAYSRSKLELLLLTREFGRRLRGTGVSVNAVHPGFVHSGFGQNNRGAFAGAIWVFGAAFGRRPARGAETPLFVATSPSLDGTSGEYFSNCAPRSGSPASRDAGAARRLYRVCLERTGAPELRDPAAERDPPASAS